MNHSYRATMLVLLCLMLMPSVYAQSKGDAYELLSGDSIGTHPRTQDTHVGKLAHWSMFVNGGITMFDGDFKQDYDLLPKTGIKPTIGLGVEYSISPIWGVGLEYNWNRFGVSASSDEGDVTLKSDMHTADIFVNADMMDVFMPRRTKEIFSLYLGIGVGVAFYNSRLEREGQPDIVNDPDRDYTTTATFPLSVLLEWNIGRHIGLGLRGQYRFYAKDNLDTKEQGTKGDILEDVDLMLRYKFAAKKKDHIRNLIPRYEQNLELQELAILKSRMDDLDRAMANMAPEVIRISQEAYGPDSDKDGVPDSRDLEPNTPGNAVLVDYWGRTIECCQATAATTTAKQGAKNEEIEDDDPNRTYRFIYFDLDSYVLNEESKLIIAEVAERMQHHPNCKVEIRAYCDGVGSEEYNKKLALMRAAVVKKQLNEVFGIDNERMINNPFGRIGEINKKFAANRRVEFHFSE